MWVDCILQNGYFADIFSDDADIIGLNQKTFDLRGLPIKSCFFTVLVLPLCLEKRTALVDFDGQGHSSTDVESPHYGMPEDAVKADGSG